MDAFIVGVAVLMFLYAFFNKYPGVLLAILKALALVIVVPLGAIGIFLGLLIKRELDVRELGFGGLLKLPFQIGKDAWSRIHSITLDDIKNDANT